MNQKIFKDFLDAYRNFTALVQTPLGTKDARKRIDEFDLNQYLQKYQSTGEHFYLVTDIVNQRILKVGGDFEKMTGYKVSQFENKSFAEYMKIHRILEMIRVVRGMPEYYKYVYSRPVEERPEIKFFYTFELTPKFGKPFQCLSTSMPILFSEENKIIYEITFYNRINDFKNDKEMLMYTLNASNDHNVLKLPILVPKVSKEDLVEELSYLEIKVLKRLSQGKVGVEIAAELNIPEPHVAEHRKSVLQKTGSKSTAEMITKALMTGII